MLCPHSPVVVRAAPFPFCILKYPAHAEETPPRGSQTGSFGALRVATWCRKPPETPGNLRKPPKMLPGNPGIIVHGITISKNIRCVHTQKRVGSSLPLTLSALRPQLQGRMAVQDTLQKLLLHGKAGGLCAKEQLKAWFYARLGWVARQAHFWYETRRLQRGSRRVVAVGQQAPQ